MQMDLIRRSISMVRDESSHSTCYTCPLQNKKLSLSVFFFPTHATRQSLEIWVCVVWTIDGSLYKKESGPHPGWRSCMITRQMLMFVYSVWFMLGSFPANVEACQARHSWLKLYFFSMKNTESCQFTPWKYDFSQLTPEEEAMFLCDKMLPWVIKHVCPLPFILQYFIRLLDC